MEVPLGSAYALRLDNPCIPNDTIGFVSACRFDFTLLFEQLILSTLPSFIYLFVAFPRIYYLSWQEGKILQNSIKNFKFLLTIAVVLLQLTLLIQWILTPSLRTAVSIPSTVLNLIVAVQIVLLSHLENSRSIRPSSILNVYLLFSSALDITQARTLYLLQDDGSWIAAAFMATVGLKFALFVLEAQGKGSYLKFEYHNLSPESTSSIINQSFMWWLNGLFLHGWQNLISLQDLYPLDEDMTAESLGKKMQKAWNDRSQPEGQFTLVFAIWRCLWRPFAHVVFPRLCLIGFTFAQPFLITRVIDLVGEIDDTNSRNQGYGLIGATALIYLGIAISSLHSSHNLFRFITMFRGAAISLIYNRTLLLEDGVYNESAAVTLMSTDVDRIAFCFEELNECWSRLIEIAIGIPLLARQLGWVSIVPLIIVSLSTFGCSIVTKFIGKRQRIWADATQRRIAITSSMLNDMKSLKMTGLTEMMSETIQNERVKETKCIEGFCWVIVWKNVVANIPFVMSPAATFGVYAIQAHMRGSNSMDTTRAFTSLALITLVSNPASRLLAAIPNTAASIGCFDRIQAFLLAKSRVDHRIYMEINSSHSSHLLDIKDNNGTRTEPLIKAPDDVRRLLLRIENAYIKPASNAELVLSGANLSIYEGSTVMIIGPVGTGKTTLLNAVLGEIPCDQGTISIATKEIAYCSQTPWLPNGSVRQVICGFVEDNFVDQKWYETVINACALTYDFSNLSSGEHTRIGSRGISLSGGQKQRIALARALYSRAKVVVLDDVLSALDKRTEKSIVEKFFGDDGIFKKMGATVILVTHATQYLSLADQVVVLNSANGVLMQGTHRELKEAGLINFDAQNNDDNNNHEDKPEKVLDNSSLLDLDEKLLKEVVVADEARDLNRQTGDMAVYNYYFRSVGLLPMLAFVSSVILHVFSGSFSQIWLKWWTDIDGGQIVLYISIYFLLSFGYSFGNGGYAWAICVWIGPSTGRKLHQVLLNTVMRAPQSFFTKTEIGTIINKFSNDMTLVEGRLAYGLLAAISNLVSCLAEAALVATGSSYMALTIPLFMLAIYFLQKTYLRTSRQLRFLDLETRSPIHSHFLETLEGLSTIRAFRWEKESLRVNNKCLDDSQKPYYLLFCIQRWLALVLDLMVAAMAVIVVALATMLRGSTSAGLLGVSLNNVLSFNGSLSAFVTGWTVLETSLGAIARLRDFEAETEVEAKEGEDVIPSKDWPSQGLIEIKNVSASYNSSTTALKNITLKILPGQKVGICGRTGSGKSSLLSTILRLLDYSSGTIKIDGFSLSTLPRSLIRSRLTALPQDPLHLTGTVRFNVNPLSTSTDRQIITVLEKVRLWTTLSERGGLDVDLLPDSLSKGQFQLLALARALLHKSKVVLLDEATSSVDKETDRIMQEVMREEFRHCTVLVVAHRVENLADADVVVVMEQGAVVEVGSPGDVLKSR